MLNDKRKVVKVKEYVGSISTVPISISISISIVSISISIVSISMIYMLATQLINEASNSC